MTPEEIETYRRDTEHDEICDLALDGLRFRKWIKAKSSMLLGNCKTPDEYRNAIDRFIVDRG